MKPGDILTYRVDWKNTGDGAATSFVFTDLFPTGTEYVKDSSKINGEKKTDANDSDAVTVTNTGVNFSLGSIGEAHTSDKTDTGYVLFKVAVKNPNTNTAISNTASYTYSEYTLGNISTNTTTNPVTTFTISGKIYYDKNINEKQDSDETGLENVTLKLYVDSDKDNGLNTDKDNLLGTATSNSEGSYTFSSLGPETYFILVDETTLSGTSWKIGAGGNPKKSILDGKDSASDINFGYYKAGDETPDTNTNTSGNTNKDKETSKKKSASKDTDKSSIGDLVWNDKDRDQRVDTNEAGLKDMKVLLYEDTNNSGKLEEIKDERIHSTTTNSNGNYSFDNLGAGTFFVFVDTDSKPKIYNGYTLTTDNSPKKVVLTSGHVRYTAADFDFALPTSTIGDFIYFDLNKNNTPESEEEGAENVGVQLYADSNGSKTFEPDSDALISQTTTSDLGIYAFNHVGKGQYFVLVDSETLPENFTVATENPLNALITTDTNQKVSEIDFALIESQTSLGEAEELLGESEILSPGIEDTVSIQEQPIVLNGEVVEDSLNIPDSQTTIVLQGKKSDCANCSVTITLSSDGSVYTTTTNEKGEWSMELPAQSLSEENSGIHLQIANEQGVVTERKISLQVVRRAEEGDDSWMAIIGMAALFILVIIMNRRKKTIYNDDC